MKYKNIFFLVIFFIFNNNVYSNENKILFKVNNNIITSIDLLTQISYLKIFNPEIVKLDRNEIIEISKNTLIKMKIKENEILKNNLEATIEEEKLTKLIENTFLRIGIKNIKDFEEYLKKFNLELKDIKERIIIEYNWNELILRKYSQKIKIDRNKLKEEIINSNYKKNKSYLLYEILFKPRNNMASQLEEIKKTINDSGFKNAALIYSISDTSKEGGYVGWVNENALNDTIKNELLKLKKNDYSKPILTPSGFAILMYADTIEEEIEINIDEKIKELTIIRANNLLNQYSNLYFNKIKNDMVINEL